MKITAFTGSPRNNGNSSAILKAFLEGCRSVCDEDDKSETEVIRTEELNLKPCRGCLMCNALKRCAIRGDDWNELSAKIEASDILAFSTPIYFHHTTSSMKRMIDRFRSFIHVKITEDGLIHKPHKPWAKKIFLFTAHGSSDVADAEPLNTLFGFINKTLGEKNYFYKLNAVRLAVAGQIEFSEKRLYEIYKRLELPESLVHEDFLKKQSLPRESPENGNSCSRKNTLIRSIQ